MATSSESASSPAAAEPASLAERIAQAKAEFDAIPASKETAAAKRAARERWLALRDGPAVPRPVLPRPIGFKR